MPKLSGQSLVCDSSSLISLTDSCFVHALYFLRKKHRGKFIIPPSVEYECVGHPLHMKMHALHALRLKRAILDGAISVVELPDTRLADELRWLANNCFYADGTPLRLLQQGEVEMLSLAKQIGVDNLLIDERTTRLLSEDPEALRMHLESELHRPISVERENLSSFQRATKGMRFFRSSELLLLAYEKGFFSDYGELEDDAIGASLYRLKYAGCAIGMGELERYLARHMQK